MKTLIKQQFFTDGSHGWLKVSKSRLDKLNISDKITSCSFMRGEFAYLEEDCDVSTYVKALFKKDGIDENDSEQYTTFMKQFWNNTTTNDSSNSRSGSVLRNYDNFVHYSIDEKKELEDLKARMIESRNWNKRSGNLIKNANLSDLRVWSGEYNF